MVVIFSYLDKMPGFSKTVDICLNFCMGFCNTLLVLPNCKKANLILIL